MKFAVAFSTLLALASALKSTSDLGAHVLSQARLLAQNQDDAITYNWVSGYSLKFQGCEAIKQWNDNANDDADVRIATKRLVLFRLCPSDTCSARKAAGCNSGYGDYVVDMDVFVEAWLEAHQQQIETKCQSYLNSNCNCQDSDDKADDFNADYCEYDCFKKTDMTECIDRNPYVDDQGQQQQVNMQDYAECKQLNNVNDDGNAYYMGPYCSEQGGAITLGVFNDDACTEFATVSYATITGMQLPFSESSSIVTADCISCLEQNNDQNGNDQYDADQVRDSCEQLYTYAGKCEAALPSGMVTSPNNNACSFMNGIRVVRKDGIIDTGSSRPSATATAFIVIFAMAFAAMAFYVWYLRARLNIKKDSLL